MLDDAFMLPLLPSARLGIADPRMLAAGFAEYRGYELLNEIQERKQIDRAEAESQLREWVARRGGELHAESHPSRRPTGSLFPTAASGGTSLIVVLPDTESA